MSACWPVKRREAEHSGQRERQVGKPEAQGQAWAEMKLDTWGTA